MLDHGMASKNSGLTLLPFCRMSVYSLWFHFSPHRPSVLRELADASMFGTDL